METYVPKSVVVSQDSKCRKQQQQATTFICYLDFCISLIIFSLVFDDINRAPFSTVACEMNPALKHNHSNTALYTVKQSHVRFVSNESP